MDFTSMTKKEFKDYINANGFFVNFNATQLDKTKIDTSENGGKLMKKLPKGDNILVFEGIASQNYGLGEKNRNGYKIDQKGWDFKNYKNNPLMLLQHNHTYGGIGHSVRLSLDKSGNLVNMFYVDLNTLDEKTRYQVENGYITAVSTSHISKEDMIEDNKTGKRYTIEEAHEAGISVWKVAWGMSEDYVMVVTKAEMIENSLVTIGSNADAIVSHNSVGSYFTNKYMENMKITQLQKDELLAQGLTTELKAKINEMEVVEEETEEMTEEVAEEETEETTEEAAEETTEEATEEEEKEEEKEEEDKTVKKENDVSEEAEEVEKDKDEEVKEDEEVDNTSENDESNTEADENSEEEKEETSENDETVVSENGMKQLSEDFADSKTNFNKELSLRDDKIKALEDKLVAAENGAVELKEGLQLALENLIEVKGSLKKIVTNGVSAYTEKSTTESDNRLTNLLTGLKR